MNIQDITTPAELAAANEEARTPLELAVEGLKNCDYTETKNLVTWLVTNMLDYHKSQAVDCFKGESEGSPLAWAHDAGKLEVILNTLKTID